MIKTIFILIFFYVLPVSGQKTYFKNFYDNGNLKSEGWISDNKKVDYWFYYYGNGIKKEEGHYLDDKKAKWWLIYNNMGKIQKKIEYRNNLPEGLCIFYANGKIVKAARYNAGIKMNEWNSISSYQRDNP